MPAKKIIVKKKGSVALTPKVILQDQSSKPGPSKTLHIPDPDEEEALDNSATGAVAVQLNSATRRDPVEQRPLNPEKSERSPEMDLTQDLTEPTFKFFCYRCGQKLKVPFSWANLSTTCGRCGRDLVVPPPLV